MSVRLSEQVRDQIREEIYNITQGESVFGVAVVGSAILGMMQEVLSMEDTDVAVTVANEKRFIVFLHNFLNGVYGFTEVTVNDLDEKGQVVGSDRNIDFVTQEGKIGMGNTLKEACYDMVSAVIKRKRE